MPALSARHGGTAILFEMEEFAAFSAATQRYIRRSLDVGLRRCDAVDRWARSEPEADRIRRQEAAYEALERIRALLAEAVTAQAAGALIAALLPLTLFDLGEKRVPDFAAYRFLYERLLGAQARPWLPTVFCAAAASPNFPPEQRRAFVESAAAALACNRWSPRDAGFLPEWVEKVDAPISA